MLRSTTATTTRIPRTLSGPCSHTEAVFMAALASLGRCGRSARLHGACAARARPLHNTIGVLSRSRTLEQSGDAPERSLRPASPAHGRSEPRHRNSGIPAVTFGEVTKRPRTRIGLPVMLTREELAAQIDPYPSAQRPQPTAQDALPAAQVIPPRNADKTRWPARLQQFVGTLPICNYANDFILWDMTADDIWEKYQLLPEPRCLAISRTALRFVLDALAKEKPRTRKGLSRYMSIMDEMRAQRPPVVPLVAEWTSAISFLGRSHRHPLSADLDNCMDLWDEMENKFGVLGNRATFNVLIDIAIKAKRWQTAEVLLTEMQSRGISFDRYTWTSQIHKAGYRKDGDEIRRTARLMIESGEVVDILVINCIMSALIRADEAQEAEHLFERIKTLTAEATKGSESAESGDDNVPAVTTGRLTSQYQERARLNRSRMKSGTALRELDTSPQFAIRTPYYLAPDVASFNMFVQHHCTSTGKFARVTELLEDMERFKIRDSVALFKSLFSGFALHGDVDRSWSPIRLGYIFETLMRTSDVRLTPELARLAIRAFGVVADNQAVNAAWNRLDRAWQEQGGDPLKRSSNVMQEYAVALNRKDGRSLRHS